MNTNKERIVTIECISIEDEEYGTPICPVLRVLGEKVANLYFNTFSYNDENAGYEGLTLLKQINDEGKSEFAALTLRTMFAIEGETEAITLFDILEAIVEVNPAVYGMFMDAFLNDEDIALMVWSEGIRSSLSKMS